MTEKLNDWHEMLPAANDIRRLHPAGCCWHIVLGDGNVDDEDVEFCAQLIGNMGSKAHPACAALVPLMRRASPTQRLKLFGSNYQGEPHGL